MNSNKIKILFIFFQMLTTAINAQDPKILFDLGNEAYAKNDYKQAIILYDSVLKMKYESSELYYNLGNAHFKSDNLGQAILNYEKAKKLDPDNEDIQANLDIANQRTEDKMEGKTVFFASVKNSILSLFTEKQWSMLFILIFSVSIILFVVYVVSKRSGMKQIGFFGGFFMVLVTVLLFFLAKNKRDQTAFSTEAIVLSGSVTVTGSPSENGTKLFILHEGTKVSINESTEDWTEIKISNGNTGWVKNSVLGTI